MVTKVSHDLLVRVAAQLPPGEQTIWVGRPAPGRFIRRFGAELVLFVILWILFATFWLAGALGRFRSGTGFTSESVVIPLILVITFLCAPLLRRWRKARGTTYAITDRRALILEGGKWERISLREFAPRMLPGLRRIQNRDGSGDLIFERSEPVGRGGQASAIGFLAIPRVREVERLLRQLAHPDKQESPDYRTSETDATPKQRLKGHSMTPESTLPAGLAELVSAELEPGERIRWLGQPLAPLFFFGAGIFAFLTGLAAAAFVAFILTSRAEFQLPAIGLAPFCGAIFLLLLAGGLVLVPISMRRTARRTAYVITDRRAFILDASAWRSIAFRSFGPAQLEGAHSDARRDGSGDLMFEPEWPDGDKSTDKGFRAIPDVNDVAQLARQLVDETAEAARALLLERSTPRRYPKTSSVLRRGHGKGLYLFRRGTDQRHGHVEVIADPLPVSSGWSVVWNVPGDVLLPEHRKQIEAVAVNCLANLFATCPARSGVRLMIANGSWIGQMRNDYERATRVAVGRALADAGILTPPAAGS